MTRMILFAATLLSFLAPFGETELSAKELRQMGSCFIYPGETTWKEAERQRESFDRIDNSEFFEDCFGNITTAIKDDILLSKVEAEKYVGLVIVRANGWSSGTLLRSFKDPTYYRPVWSSKLGDLMEYHWNYGLTALVGMSDDRVKTLIYHKKGTRLTEYYYIEDGVNTASSEKYELVRFYVRNTQQ